ncbi:MAG: SDR family NAD(P)-dependent oxidoreductase [Spirochaetes bacterium]|nr:SDR family NAD(P)-dependent oxidoreductase [Spirochaetota bacterium]
MTIATAPSRVVITGSTRGLGFQLAREFLRRGCMVVVSGRTRKAVNAALSGLRAELPRAAVYGIACDVADPAQVQALWDGAVKALGVVDHWINNAGIGQPMIPIWDLDPGFMEVVVRTDLLGVLYGARVAMRGMTSQPREPGRAPGAIWFMEGHGSDGSVRRGLSVYGAAKRGLRYVARALAVEARGTGVLVGALSPGIMVTDFLLKPLDRRDAAAWERTKRVFNILADRPETVAAFLAPRVLATRRTGTLIAWLTGPKILFRFLFAGILKRKVIPD